MWFQASILIPYMVDSNTYLKIIEDRITMDRDIDVRGDPKESNSIRLFVNLSVEEIDCMHDSLINIGVL